MGQEKPPIVYYAFDVLRLNGKDLQNLPIEERKAKLEELLKRPPGVIRYSVSFTKVQNPAAVSVATGNGSPTFRPVMFCCPRTAFCMLERFIMQAAWFAPFFQAVMPINSTPTSKRRTAITTDNSISVVPRWRVCEFKALR